MPGAQHKFENYIEKANSAKTKQELFQIYSNAVAAHGLDRVMLCLVSDHRDIGESSGMKFMHNYPEDWMSFYLQKELNFIDPVIILGRQTNESFEWSKVKEMLHLSQEQKICLEMGIEAGLNNGICTPLRGPNYAIGGLSLASSEKKDNFDGNIDLINAYSNHFYLAYRRLGLVDTKFKTNEIKNIALTKKEREVLRWAGLGKTSTEIGMIIGVSNDTVNFHFRNIFRKLEVNSKILAVVKASILGLIEPPKLFG